MRRIPHLAGTILVAGLVHFPPSVHAATPPTGTITCSLSSDVSASPKAILFRPFINGEPRTVRIAATNVGSSCDNSGVSGGKVPITGVAIKLTARMADGTCGALTSPLVMLDNARITLKWRGLNGSHYTTVATTRARIQSVGYDSMIHTLNLVTAQSTGNAFVGNQFTIRLGFDDYAELFEANCGNASGFIAMGFGNDRPASISNQ